MENAHLRLGRLEYDRNVGKRQTKTWLHIDRFIGDKEQGYFLSAFGRDAEVGTITAAVHETHEFDLVFPDGSRSKVCFGPKPACFKGMLKVPELARPVRHLLVASATLLANGTAGTTILMNCAEDTIDLAWSTLVGLLGLPADPRWAKYILNQLEQDQRLRAISGIGCQPVIVQASREDLMECCGKALTGGKLPFPKKNGPVLWPRFTLAQALRIA
ncbi:hypothetical protein [Edaphobacter dinghuensis]|uniref:Uncharacterized protein n=1 Tax=Edaphobacter dinghuensis TaxID=1560005 RepID=A0A917HRM1_9BACT|nr:hypothetical protein [Edaphobacter dinghuensis]GGG87002.1 hypothetical protein GCM10011585_33750 [Edaphobacter dinghuensis]